MSKEQIVSVFKNNPGVPFTTEALKKRVRRGATIFRSLRMLKKEYNNSSICGNCWKKHKREWTLGGWEQYCPACGTLLEVRPGLKWRFVDNPKSRSGAMQVYWWIAPMPK